MEGVTVFWLSEGVRKRDKVGLGGGKERCWTALGVRLGWARMVMGMVLKNEERKLEEQKGRNLEQFARAPTPRRGDSRLGVQSSNPGVAHPRLGMATNA
ncbi:hypothetical protein PIB30_083723 [Stylosanthes scabra]|uniref:Uncharacterized protein n=1 Tax=Stylosanthes scabra TaxID=79078 RepID=A0ABU6YRK6_9FABA|nr:hypothetical protein [Stylosanthes scabra]